ncbi:hypothetical protein GGP41_001031 [Bipolaris sorokiniana]|uniref:Uncharacterized protein n=1 Tax=Cochliobolus sativus TaxID=45130 RepID=A0A8H6DXP2_COCSA|nr:hypothetical protein GGP41_001031 [Bipolaris sorokiniana]
MVLAYSYWLILAPKVRFRFLSEDFSLRLQLKDFKIRFRRELINISGCTSLLIAARSITAHSLRRISRDATLSRRRTTIREETVQPRPVFNGSVAFFDSLKPVLYL